MTWQDSRRRKRVWYRHYKRLCDELMALQQAALKSGQPVAAEAFIKIMFDLYEQRRLHRRKRVAYSAWESFELAAKDAGLLRSVWRPAYTGSENQRGPAIGEFGAESKYGTSQLREMFEVNGRMVVFDEPQKIGEFPPRTDVPITKPDEEVPY